MFITTVFMLIPFAFIAAALFTFLYFDNKRIFHKINKTVIRIFLYSITSLAASICITILLSIVGLSLLIGIIGLPLLIILDIIGIVLVVKRIIIKTKKRNKN